MCDAWGKTSVCNFNCLNTTRRLIECIECFASSEHAWMFLCPFSPSCHYQDASCCVSQRSPSSVASISFHASDVSTLEHAAMFHKHFCVDFDIAEFKAEVMFFELWQFWFKHGSCLKLEMKNRNKNHLRSKDT